MYAYTYKQVCDRGLCVNLKKKKSECIWQLLHVSAYGDVLKTGTYMNFIMYLCVSLRMMHTDVSQSRNTQNRENGEGRGQGKHNRYRGEGGTFWEDWSVILKYG